MKLKVMVVAFAASLALGAAFILLPRSEATQPARTYRKGPRAMPLSANRAGHLLIGNLRFTDETEKAVILFDVTNPTPEPVLAFTVRAGTYSVTPHGTADQPAIAPGGTLTCSIATDNVADDAQLVLTAVRFTNGDEHGEAGDLKLIRETLERQD